MFSLVEETTNRIILHLVSKHLLGSSEINLIADEMVMVCCRARIMNKAFVVDFANVTSMSSAFLGKLVLLNKYAVTRDVRLRLTNVRGDVLEMFNSMHLNKVFRFEDDNPPTQE